MNAERADFRWSIPLAMFVYCVLCFACSALIYFIMLKTGKFEFRNASGNVVHNVVLAPETILIETILAGVWGMLFSLVGLPSLYIASNALRPKSGFQLLFAVILAIMISGACMYFSAFHHPFLLLLGIGAISLIIAGAVRTSFSARLN